ncbi:MAG: hypothetical protein OEV27_06015 [Nitrospira sp.]|nr:hypothetical protein [Nitrospira sp.]MDH4250730.1 hypothetical protein [Nitrospira sp.]MDH4343994.1 hypothetical protein [Nitrospira sp.]MDH5336139.1 hypothetical protein [Nitrospira sp.]
MIRQIVRGVSIGLIVISAVGCHSIHSDAVRDLIRQEGTKIDAAQTNIDLFQKETEARIKFLEQARSSLHESVKALQAQEAKHQFVLSSYRNVASKKGEAAYAAAYLVGQMYLIEYQGLEKAVWDQFEEDFCGLRDTANALNDSWKHTAAIHAQVKRYADKSGLASVDPEFVAALVEQAPGQSERIMEILNHSRTVNDALEEVTGSRIIRSRTLQRGYTFTADLVDLLDKLKKDDGQ